MNPFLVPLFVVISTFCTPYDGVEEIVLNFLSECKHECLVGAYTINNPRIIDELVELKKSGVDVQVITDTTQASGKNEVIAIHKLRRNGVAVYIGRSANDQLMHAKFIVIDGTASEDGSYNFTISANNQDNIIHINHNQEEAQKLRKYWFQIKEDLR